MYDCLLGFSLYGVYRRGRARPWSRAHPMRTGARITRAREARVCGWHACIVNHRRSHDLREEEHRLEPHTLHPCPYITLLPRFSSLYPDAPCARAHRRVHPLGATARDMRAPRMSMWESVCPRRCCNQYQLMCTHLCPYSFRAWTSARSARDMARTCGDISSKEVLFETSSPSN